MMKEMFPKLGVAEAIASKITNTGVSAVAAGTADLALQPVSELVHAPGARYIGPIPADVQYLSIFTAALISKAPHGDDARADAHVSGVRRGRDRGAQQRDGTDQGALNRRRSIESRRLRRAGVRRSPPRRAA